MPRRIAVQVPQTVSRLLRGGYLKDTPLAFPTLLSHPPSPLPPRAPTPRPIDDLPPSLVPKPSGSGASSSSTIRKRDPLNSAKKVRQQTPKLHPKPITYLSDKVRAQFFADHPWEKARPRMLVEGRVVDAYGGTGSTGRMPAGLRPEDVTDLSQWGKNPSPEDVISCVVHLHNTHSLSLSAAYQRTISAYHALRAEHEHASRFALLEARAYGSTFGPLERFKAEVAAASSFSKRPAARSAAAGDDPLDANHTAVETLRGFVKEERVLEEAAKELRGTTAAALAGDAEAAQSGPAGNRFKSVDGAFTGGAGYFARAVASRDPKSVEQEGDIATGATSGAESAQGQEAHAQEADPEASAKDPLGLGELLRKPSASGKA